MNNAEQQMKIKVDINTLETVTCPNCKNSILKTDLSVFKKLPSIQSPTGRAQLIRIDLVSCPACNHFFHIKDGELFPFIISKETLEPKTK